MSKLAEIREKYPQYADVSDDVLAKGLHAKHYADMPYEDFAVKVGLQTQVEQANPSLFRMDSDFQDKSGAGFGTMLGGAARDMFGSRESAGRYIAEKVGGELVETPEGPLVKLKDGQTYRLNDPGLDSTDVANVAGNIAGFTPAAQLAGMGRRLMTRMGIGAAAAGATDVGMQAAFTDDQEEFNPVRTAIATGGGGAGELIAPLIGRILPAMGRSPTEGSARAAEILRRDLGIESPTVAQVQTMSRGLDEIDAGADPATVLGADEFGFLYTRGQRLQEGPGKFRAQSQEEVLRQDAGMAGDRMRAVDRSNRAALESSVTRITDEVAGPRAGMRPQSPVEAFEQIGERTRGYADELQGRVSGAYDRAAAGNRAAVSADAVREVPQRITQALREFPIGDLTPATRDTLTRLRGSVEGLQPGTKGVTLRAIEDQRKLINNAYGATANQTDRAALGVLKREYDQWLDSAFDNALISGDEAALAAMRDARGLRAEFGRRFEGDNADVDKFVQALIGGDKTPDELINVALGASQVSKAGAARYIDRLRVATNNDPEVLGALKAAHIMRLTQGKTGETLGMQAVRSNILAAEQNTPSVLRSLYRPEEWTQIRRLAASLEPLVDRGTFARRPGTADQLLRAMQSLPFLGKGIEWVQKPVRVVQADRAMGRLAPLPSPRPAAASGAAVGVESQRQ